MAQLGRGVLAAALAFALLVPTAVDARPAKTMRLGFVDNTFGSTPPRFDLADQNGAGIVRVTVFWVDVAQQPPANPTDPADPVYNWAPFDAKINAATQLGLTVLLNVNVAPPWAEAPGRDPEATAGSWRPNAEALGQFFTAVARHYSGRTPGVPRVRLFQVWNEPNLSRYITPQGEGDGRKSPVIYRAMLNAAYTAVKQEDPGATVVTAGTAPYGGDSSFRTRPVQFWRQVLCLTPKLRRSKRCPAKPHFDVWAHQPYGVGGPTQEALHPDDAAIPDVGRVSRVFDAALKRKTVRPLKRKPGWVTEFSWDSSPPDPDGVPAETHARWLEGALYEFWKAGIKTALWFQVIDQAPIPSYGATNQSGTNLMDGTPKVAAKAYQFPFVAPQTGRRALVWGLAPEAGRVQVQRRTGAGWRAVGRARASAGRVFTARLKVAPRSLLRARQGAAKSLPWRVGVDGV